MSPDQPEETDAALARESPQAAALQRNNRRKVPLLDLSKVVRDLRADEEAASVAALNAKGVALLNDADCDSSDGSEASFFASDTSSEAYKSTISADGHASADGAVQDEAEESLTAAEQGVAAGARDAAANRSIAAEIAVAIGRRRPNADADLSVPPHAPSPATPSCHQNVEDVNGRSSAWRICLRRTHAGFRRRRCADVVQSTAYCEHQRHRRWLVLGLVATQLGIVAYALEAGLVGRIVTSPEVAAAVGAIAATIGLAASACCGFWTRGPSADSARTVVVASSAARLPSAAPEEDEEQAVLSPVYNAPIYAAASSSALGRESLELLHARGGGDADPQSLSQVQAAATGHSTRPVAVRAGGGDDGRPRSLQALGAGSHGVGHAGRGNRRRYLQLKDPDEDAWLADDEITGPDAGSDVERVAHRLRAGVWGRQGAAPPTANGSSALPAGDETA
mmetsp:Transcript_76402/g.212242  ORF Transcript_76402/g.212242 Transcript_76402/m.212242 type:complete len:452 (+) Transcript_76402:156-1511(+)